MENSEDCLVFSGSSPYPPVGYFSRIESLPKVNVRSHASSVLHDKLIVFGGVRDKAWGGGGDTRFLGIDSLVEYEWILAEVYKVHVFFNLVEQQPPNKNIYMLSLFLMVVLF